VVLVSVIGGASLLGYLLFAPRSGSQRVQGEDVIVSIELFSSNPYSGKSYSPIMIVVVLGVNDTVTWRNDDNVAHTVTANDGSFDSGIIGAGEKWVYSFTQPGVHSYYCVPHPWMTGTVVVKG